MLDKVYVNFGLRARARERMCVCAQGLTFVVGGVDGGRVRVLLFYIWTRGEAQACRCGGESEGGTRAESGDGIDHDDDDAIEKVRNSVCVRACACVVNELSGELVMQWVREMKFEQHMRFT